MGGLGSGNWHRCQGKKSTVEESLVLSLKDLRNGLVEGGEGLFAQTGNSGSASFIAYKLTGDKFSLIMTLCYRWQDADEVTLPIQMTTTPTQFGRPRWWFSCPLNVHGLPCNRRAAKLYLPPGAKYFGCRKCHDLTYRSCQEAHQTERHFGRMGFGPEVAKLWEKMHREY